MDIYIKKVDNGYLVITSANGQTILIAKDSNEVIAKVSELLTPIPTKTPLN